MTTGIDPSNPTLHDIEKTRNPDGTGAKIAEVLKKKCPILEYVTWQEGNLPTGHRVTTETGIPSIGYRAFNEGVETGKFTAGQYDEVCGLMEGHSQLDVKLAELHGSSAEYRMQTDMRFMRAFKQEFETGFIYNSTAASPRKFNGLAPRYNSLSGAYARQVVDSSVAGGTGNDQTSMWLICFSPETVFCFTGKGMVSGIQHEDMGIQMVPDEAGNRFRAYESVWNWTVGVCVADYEAVVRIANIDTGSIVGTGHLLLDDMDTAWFRLRDPEMGRCVWVCNRTVAEFLHKQAKDSVTSSTLSIQEDMITGRRMTHYMGAPVVISDAILSTEAPIA